MLTIISALFSNFFGSIKTRLAEILALVFIVSTIGLGIYIFVLKLDIKKYQAEIISYKTNIKNLEEQLVQENNRIQNLNNIYANNQKILSAKLKACFNTVNYLQQQLSAQNNNCTYIEQLQPNTKVRTTSNPKNDAILNALDNLF